MIEGQKLGFYSDLEQNFFLPTLLLIISFPAIVLSFHNFSKLLLDLQIPFLWYMQLKNALPSVNVSLHITYVCITNLVCIWSYILTP